MVIVAAGCSEEDPAHPMHDTEQRHQATVVAPAIAPLSGTDSMAQELAMIYKDQLHNPFRYYHLNRVRAESLWVTITRARGEVPLPARYFYIHELTLAGLQK